MVAASLGTGDAGFGRLVLRNCMRPGCGAFAVGFAGTFGSQVRGLPVTFLRIVFPMFENQIFPENY